MRSRVYTPRHAAQNDQPMCRQIARQHLCHSRAIRRRMTRPDDGNSRLSQQTSCHRATIIMSADQKFLAAARDTPRPPALPTFHRPAAPGSILSLLPPVICPRQSTAPTQPGIANLPIALAADPLPLALCRSNSLLAKCAWVPVQSSWSAPATPAARLQEVAEQSQLLRRFARRHRIVPEFSSSTLYIGDNISADQTFRSKNWLDVARAYPWLTRMSSRVPSPCLPKHSRDLTISMCCTSWVPVSTIHRLFITESSCCL